jgi:predicted dehydrogenase
MPGSQRYRAAAIGRTGGGNYGHSLHLAFQGVENVEFVAVADADEAGRRKAVAETGAAREYAEYRQMLERERLDIVSVCPRWVDCHVEMVLACLDAGCHVYCEKPMTGSLEEGDRIVAAARRAGRKVAVAHQGVYLPGAQTVKRLLGEGRIGTVQAIYAHGKQDKRGGGEDMITLGTHLMNMMRFFVGDVAWMSAHVTVGGREMTRADARQPTEPVGLVAGDAVDSYFAFQSGVAGFFDSRKDQPGPGTRYGMEITGSEGFLAIRGGAADEVAVYPHPLLMPLDGTQRWEAVPIPDGSLARGNQLAIRDLIAAIEEEREPISSAAGAVAALEMILGAYESQLTGARVEFPMKNRKHPLAA